MLVLSNLRLGPGAELLVSDDVARTILRSVAGAAAPFAQARWEHELVRWLEMRADAIGERSTGPDGMSTLRREAHASSPVGVLDVGQIAWTPDHFETQRRFLLDAIGRAAGRGEHTLVLDRWRGQIEAHPADSVQVGRRWQWQPTA
jgi:hypothetical protein